MTAVLLAHPGYKERMAGERPAILSLVDTARHAQRFAGDVGGIA
jgi:hypothetical protein